MTDAADKKFNDMYKSIKVDAFQSVLDEIKSEKYETVSQIIGCLHNNIEIHNKLNRSNAE